MLLQENLLKIRTFRTKKNFHFSLMLATSITFHLVLLSSSFLNYHNNVNLGFSQNHKGIAKTITRVFILKESSPKSYQTTKNGALKSQNRVESLESINDKTHSKVNSGENTLLSRYLSEVRNTIVKNKYKNRKASKLNLKGPVEVAFTIQKPNIIKDIQILKSSGYVPLDQSAIQTLSKMEEFPQIPDDLEIANISINFTLEYL